MAFGSLGATGLYVWQPTPLPYPYPHPLASPRDHWLSVGSVLVGQMAQQQLAMENTNMGKLFKHKEHAWMIRSRAPSKGCAEGSGVRGHAKQHKDKGTAWKGNTPGPNGNESLLGIINYQLVELPKSLNNAAV